MGRKSITSDILKGLHQIYSDAMMIEILKTPHLNDEQMAERLGMSLRDFRPKIVELKIPYILLGKRRRYPLLKILEWETERIVYPEKIRSSIDKTATDDKFTQLLDIVYKSPKSCKSKKHEKSVTKAA